MKTLANYIRDNQISLISAGFTYGGFGIVWFYAGFMIALGVFLMIWGFIIWSNKVRM